jgi:hypothetical protein
LPGTRDYRGDWRVAGVIVHVTQRTRINSEGSRITVGMPAWVVGTRLADGSVNATMIAVAEEDDDGEGDD